MDERLMFYLKRQQQTLNTKFLKISNTEIAQELKLFTGSYLEADAKTF
jgi:hypothetical protein